MNTSYLLIDFLKEYIFSIRKVKFLNGALFLVIVFNSCNKNDTVIEEEDPIDQILNDSIINDTTIAVIDPIPHEQFAAENFGNPMVANFVGKLTDFDGNSLPDVQIKIGDRIALSDSNGVFILNEVSVNEKFAFVTAEKTDYIMGSRAVVPTTNGSNFINITLLKKNIVGIVDAGVSSETSLPNGAKVSFSGNFIDNLGAPYTGKVEVSMHYLEPNQNSTFAQMPGMLLGKSENNDAKAMESYGMLAVNLYSPSGAVLNISKDAPAKIRFPVSSTTPNSPETIPLWYFDESVGYWKEQGKATKIGNELLAEVYHFTWWNNCLPLDSVDVCFELNTGVDLANSYFTITRERNDQLVVSGATNDNGLFCGLFPKDEMLLVSIYGSCDDQNLLATQRIGPYPMNISNIEINISELSSYFTNTRLRGTVTNCDNSPVTNGYAYVYTIADAKDFEIIPIINGEINSRFTYCSANEYRIITYDVTSNAVSSEGNLNIVENGITDLGDLVACEKETGEIYEGSITLGTQEDVEEFGLLGYSKITGNLNILIESKRNSLVFEPTDITFLVSLVDLTEIGGDLKIAGSEVVSLKGLENLTSVGGDVLIHDNNNLDSLGDLEKLTSIGGDLTVVYNDNLPTLTGLENLTSVVGSVDISYHAALTSMTGLENLAFIGNYLKIDGNISLVNLSAFEKITSISSTVRITDNPKLTSLLELKNITSVGQDMSIGNNPDLTSLIGLEKITSVGGKVIIHDTGITSLRGLENLISVGDDLNISLNRNLISLRGLESLSSVEGRIYIGRLNAANRELSDFCALANLFNSGTYNEVYITNNMYNPTVQDIQDGNCKE